jgi:uncharacterized protein (DUF952 family)
MTNILHITARSAWQQAQRDGAYRAPSLDQVGYIHFSKPEQVLGVANNFYRGEPDLVLLVIDATRLAAELRYEPPDEMPDSSQRFPHLYGTLNLDAVISVLDFPPDSGDGWTALPGLNES